MLRNVTTPGPASKQRSDDAACDVSMYMSAHCNRPSTHEDHQAATQNQKIYVRGANAQAGTDPDSRLGRCGSLAQASVRLPLSALKSADRQ